MAEVECLVEELVERGWSLKQVIYDDERGCDFHATVILTKDGKDVEDGVM